jgi:hypothetical protein
MRPADRSFVGESILAFSWEPMTFGSPTGGDLAMRIPAWLQGVELSDMRLDTYSDVGCIGQVAPGTFVPTTVACLDTMFKEVLCVEPESTLLSGENTERGGPQVVAKPEGQTSAFADNRLAPRRPLVIHPSDHQGATASGCLPEQRVLPEVGSGTKPIPAGNVVPKPRNRRRQAKKPVTPSRFVCEECSEEGNTVSFNCKKDLRRHLTTTKAHGASVILACSCGKGVTRRDAMAIHHKYCPGNTQWKEGIVDNRTLATR